MPTVDQTRANVHQMFSKFIDDLHISDDGSVIFRHDSAICIIHVIEWNSEVEGRNTIVALNASVVSGVKRSKPLYEWIALSNDEFIFGHLVVRESTDKSLANIWFTHNLLGDYLDEAELMTATVALLKTADQLDDEVMHMFGGTRTFES